jgi:hypothetical protein
MTGTSIARISLGQTMMIIYKATTTEQFKLMDYREMIDFMSVIILIQFDL